ncbi:MAG: LysM peptidoglycan-binding domain-containing protein [Neorhizobium sp.]|nr:LysM peptidoglycan-binding domain-containing protein [Neorhizobium sp.]
MMRNRAGWLALIVLAIASLLMVFFVLPRIDQGSKPIGDAINAAGDAVKKTVVENAPKPEETKPAEQAAAAPKTSKPQAPAAASSATPAAPAQVPAGTAQTPAAGQSNGQATGQAPGQSPAQADTGHLPSFDVLRVEPDGSTVIAGRATAHSTLEVTDGASTVAKVDVGPSGDFAAILDKPLSPGDHALILKSTAKDGTVSTSQETATVSVPADKNGKLLALITKPGEASRVIAMPSPAGAGANAAALAGTAADAAKPGAAPSAPAAAQSASATPSAGTAGPARNGDLRVTAVEIEGSKLFVAGVSKAGASLRGEADGAMIGKTRAGTDGHFVIEGTMPLALGDHRIAVEALSASGEVIARVEVPFTRPEGDQVAAIAGPEEDPAADSAAAIDKGAFQKLRTDTVKAFNLLLALYADGKVPSLEQMAAARSATSIALKSLSDYRAPADTVVAARALVQSTGKNATAAATALDGLANDVASVGAGLKDIAELVARAVGPTLSRQIQGMGGAQTAVADADGKIIQQAPLTQSDRNSVIIRRGDTLWQISRRVYGQGVRYTTIYLANQDQINNPDIIQPGQIFGVPQEYLPDAEELHRERMMHHKG